MVSNPEGLAQSAYTRTISALNVGEGFPSGFQVTKQKAGNLKAALVVMHDEDSAIVRISFRAVDKSNLLFAAPLYYTEARFQGVIDGEGGGE